MNNHIQQSFLEILNLLDSKTVQSFLKRIENEDLITVLVHTSLSFKDRIFAECNFRTIAHLINEMEKAETLISPEKVEKSLKALESIALEVTGKSEEELRSKLNDPETKDQISKKIREYQAYVQEAQPHIEKERRKWLEQKNIRKEKRRKLDLELDEAIKNGTEDDFWRRQISDTDA